VILELERVCTEERSGGHVTSLKSLSGSRLKTPSTASIILEASEEVEE
jgi:hypothetical protein